jgi:hypothetical protein
MKKVPFNADKFELGKSTCVYRNGHAARILEINPKNTKPVLSSNKDSHLIRHFADGKEIGLDCDSPNDLFIVKESNFRAWRYEEVPVNAIIRLRATKIVYKIIHKTQCDVVLEPDLKHYSISNLDNNWECSIDEGKTWKVCGVEK